MALGFIKKVFSFGRKSDEAEAPAVVSDTAAPVTSPEAAADQAISTPSTDLSGGAEGVGSPVEIHDAGPTAEEAEALADWDAALPDPEPEPGVSDESAEEFAAEHQPPAEPAHITDISAEAAEELADWDHEVPQPEPEATTPAATEIAEPETEAASDWDSQLPDPEPDHEASQETAAEFAAAHEAPAEPAHVTDISAEDADEGKGWDAELPSPEPVVAAEPQEDVALPKGFASAAARPAEPAKPVEQPKLSWFQRLTAGLRRTSSQLSQQISSLFTKRKLDDETLEELEDLLIQADLGVETAMRVTGALSSERYGRDVTGEDVARIMASEIEKVLGPVAKPLELDLSHKPHVILVVGVNGTGKTTTIGKLAAKLSGAGLKVMLAAGDTFRAAAIEQLKIWATRTGSEFIGTQLGADAAGLAYDAYKQAIEKRSDVLIIDTAGRLQNKTELMAELEKIVRVLGKLDPDAPHTVLQTLDATTGQNALQQVEIFRNVAGVSGLVMTKLDGTARGGILVAIAAKHKLPVYFIGVGEGVDDLEPFEASDFAKAIAGVA